MVRKIYPDQYRRNAVSLYESSPGATLGSVAEELGVDRSSVARWVEAYGTGEKTAADGGRVRYRRREPLTRSWAVNADERREHESWDSPWPEQRTGTQTGFASPESKMVRLEAELLSLRSEVARLTMEWEMVRTAARYVAGDGSYPSGMAGLVPRPTS